LRNPTLSLAPPRVRRTFLDDDVLLACGHAPHPPARCVGDWLVTWAAVAPERAFLAERRLDGSWRRESYRDALIAVEGIGTALLELGASRAEPVMVLADNGVDHALVALAAMHVGVPVAPVSTAYALASADFGRLREVGRTLRPGVVVVADVHRYAPALDALAAEGLAPRALVSLAPTGDAHDRGALPIASLAATRPSPALREAFARVGPDTIAKVLFTSGSTGSPRGVVNTQRMLCANQAAIAALWPFLGEAPPVTVDWLPWSHTFGSNHNFNMILRSGGTLYVDGGRPAPGLVEQTVANLRDIAPTLYFNVPRGFDLLLPHLERDEELRLRFFGNLDLLFYAAAALPPGTRARLEKCAEAAGRADLFITSAWGSTETAPMSTSAHFPTATPANIGLPAPGVEIKLASPEQGTTRREIRVRGPNVTPGYWLPGGEIEPARLDADGYLPTGDAAKLLDEEHPERGIVFEGRLGENFKLSTGTWVAVGQLRVALIDACAPLVQDCVIAGHDREALGALLFLSPAAQGAAHDQLHFRLLAMLREHNARFPTSSHKIARALVLTRPPSLDAGETTDKGYLNQRRLLERRHADVERLFAAAPDADVIRV
jgi:feruloyl-CoA synthase